MAGTEMMSNPSMALNALGCSGAKEWKCQVSRQSFTNEVRIVDEMLSAESEVLRATE